MIDPALTLEQAQQQNRCRICGKQITVASAPLGWQSEFRERIFPLPPVTLDFGKEFAHTACLNAGT